LDIVGDEPQRRQGLLEHAAALRNELRRRGWNVGASASQIIPVILGDAERAVRLSARLAEQGLLLPAIRPPTVPEGEACLRISLTCGHTPAMIDRLLEALAKETTLPATPGAGS